LPRALGVVAKAGAEVVGLGEFALLLVAFGHGDSEEERLQLAKVAVADGEVHAEAVPGLAVSVFQVVAEAESEVGGETDVIKFSAAVKGIDAVAVADVLADDVLVFVEYEARDVLKVLTD
jgi:hypothetical protein